LILDELHALGIRVRQHSNAIEAAKLAGVKHIVYTSMPNPKQAKDIPFAPDHVETEQELENSGLDFTSLRVSWYAENLLGFLPQIISAGKWPTVAGGGKIAYIPREDVARATVAALIQDNGKNYTDISGAEAHSISEIAIIASAAFQKPIEVVPVGDDEIFEALVAIGIAPAFAPTVIMTDLNTRSGNFNTVSDEVAKATGYAPLSLKEFFNNTKSLFIK
jgi:NAD(P)H dehydrogenase (quinone)